MSNGHPNTPDLIIHPTAVALRQTQRRALERDGVFDGRRHLTLSSFLRSCASAALKDQALRPISDLDRELAIVEAVNHFRAAKAETRRHSLLAGLAPAALEETLSQLIDTVAPLADRAPEFLHLLATDKRSSKNPELAVLHTAYTDTCRTTLKVADEATLNAAILTLLRGDRTQWPPILRHAKTIAFSAVRWVAPFQESVLRALSDRLGPDNVSVRHILSDYEQDWWGGSLLTDTGRLLFGGADSIATECEFQSASTRATIEHLTSLREGYAMQDRALAEQARTRVGFSCSVGVYGEIEDLARRIAWELYDRPDPLRPEDICLVSRNLGTAADAIMDVFARFNIPHYFRRGTPVLAIPVIKTLHDLTRFSATRDRDAFCALLQSPWMDWSDAGFPPSLLADDLLRSGVEPVMDDPDRIARRLTTYTLRQHRFDSRPEAEHYAALAIRALRSAAGPTNIITFDKGLANLLARCKAFKLGVAPDPEPSDTLAVRAHLLNTKAWETVSELLEALRRHTLLNKESDNSVTWDDVIDLLNRALENVTVSASPPDESGVWILNPYDIAGLSFKVVLVAGLNAGAFPKSPTPSPLFPDAELLDLRDRLQKKGPLPVAALAASRARNSQENLLFLTTLAASRERMVFSYAGHDESGQPLTPSVFFSTLWRLVGWPAWDTLPPEPPDPYDQWRLTCASAHFRSHWNQLLVRRKTLPVISAHKRTPFPGESYLGTVPLELCRADDERRQRLAARPDSPHPNPLPQGERASSLASHIAHGIHVEHQRQTFFSCQTREAMVTTGLPADLSTQAGHDYAGILDTVLWDQLRPPQPDGIQDFSPTQLERLVACPYQYYLHDVLKVEAIEPNELEPSTMDVGTAIHAIMFEGFRILQGHTPDHSITGLAKLARTHQRLVTPAWAICDQHGAWHLQQNPERAGEAQGKPSAEALPLVDFPTDPNAVLSFFDTLTDTMLDWATSGNAVWMLGAPEQLNVQRRRIGRAVRNLVRTALSPESIPELPGCDSPCKRYPALLEYTFNSQAKAADAPSLELTDPGRPGRKLRLHGKIDRVDLIFGADKTLRAVVVIDYKGSGKAKLKVEDLAEGISTATDCQLPVYALAAARALLPAHTPDLRSQISDLKSQISDLKSQTPHLKSEILDLRCHGPVAIPMALHYLSYTLPQAEMVKQSMKQWISLDGSPQEERDLTKAFTTSVFAALDRYERGDFAVAPAACAYCELKACCRHAAGLLSPETPDSGGDL